MSNNPFRFGIQLPQLDATRWPDEVRRIEALGFSSVLVPDHFTSSLWDPTTLLASAAAVTETLKVGSLVYDVDYRHPVIYARQAATLHLMSGGRHEFGIGAGWMVEDYQWAGMRYDRPAVRIERLEEALQIIRSMWEAESTTLEGRHYQVRDVPKAAELFKGEHPRILIGGGGPKLLAVAGRHADIVGIAPMVPEGRFTREALEDLRVERVREKVRWVAEAAQAAGRDPGAIEYSAMVFGLAVGDDVERVREAFARNTPLDAEELVASPFYLTGSGCEIRDQLETTREETGISYVVIQNPGPSELERVAEEVVAPLSGR
jgi:probable F420-dependent oxidoreductase